MSPSATRDALASTLILGVGNPILGDDGVGWRVAEEVRKRLPHDDSRLDVGCAALGGLALMEQMIGYHRVVLIDAMVTGRAPVGAISCFRFGCMPGCVPMHEASPHDVSLAAALELGRAAGADLPTDIWVVGVEISRTDEFSEGLTPEVAAALPGAVEKVVAATAGTLHSMHLTRVVQPGGAHP